MSNETVDRGDDFTPTPDDPKDLKAALEQKEIAKDASDGDDKESRT